MCGRVIVDYDENMDVANGTELKAWMLQRPEGYEPSWNLKPTQGLPIALTSDKDGERHFDLAHWGIIPPWNKDGKPKFTFNARSETLLEKPTFKPSMKAQRCVVPVSGFYEWTGPKSKRIPHAIFGPQAILPMAGLYRWWKSPEEEWVLTATIITRASTGVMEPLHDRMPVFLADELITDWLDPETVGDELLLAAASEGAVGISEQLHEWEVRPLRGDGPELIEPAA
ncbi:SOS response-associated peptidase [Leucobacter musarum]|uniref:SOS response-associated peptidase n=1 Tax=Leucobacter musarum TaxID=1930747 RepID=UPI0006A7E066|nr:SOS response-associated peptidase [Leucobacter musarum]